MQWEIELKQREDDEKVMNMYLNGMSERQKIFYKTLQNEIIARCCGVATRSIVFICLLCVNYGLCLFKLCTNMFVIHGTM
jgi:hypothetical protein